MLSTMRRSILGTLAGLVLAITPALAADPVFPVSSRIGLAPPAGFVPSARFAGFENAQVSAAILLAELPGETFEDVEKAFTNELLKTRGMTVEKREQLTFKDGRGFYVTGPQESGGVRRHETVMVATVSGATMVVSVQMIEASRAILTDAVIRETLRTVTVRPDVPESERLAVLPYKMGDLAGFRIVRSSHDGTAILTQGPSDAVAAVQQPFVIIGVVPGEVTKPEERDKFAHRVFGTAPGIKNVKIIRAEPLRLGRAAGYEIVAEAKDAKSDIDVTTVQWLRFGQSGHLTMFAIVRRTAWNEVFPRLRTIRDNIDVR